MTKFVDSKQVSWTLLTAFVQVFLLSSSAEEEWGFRGSGAASNALDTRKNLPRRIHRKDLERCFLWWVIVLHWMQLVEGIRIKLMCLPVLKLVVVYRQHQWPSQHTRLLHLWHRLRVSKKAHRKLDFSRFLNKPIYPEVFAFCLDRVSPYCCHCVNPMRRW